MLVDGEEFDVSSSLECFFGSYLSKAVLLPHFCSFFVNFFNFFWVGNAGIS
jgi:hypothetical protein